MNKECTTFDNEVESAIRRINMKYGDRIKLINMQPMNEGIYISTIVHAELLNGCEFDVRVHPEQNHFVIIENEIKEKQDSEIEGIITVDDDNGFVTVKIGNVDIMELARKWFGKKVKIKRQ